MLSLPLFLVVVYAVAAAAVLLIQLIVYPCPAEAGFVKPNNIPTFDPAIKIPHCNHSGADPGVVRVVRLNPLK